MVAQRGWPTWAEAIRLSHTPQSDMDLMPQSPLRQRLAYDEILSHQLALTLVRQLQRRAEIKRPIGNHAEWRQKLLAILPFELTAAQQSAMADIDADMAAGRPMLRLLQGDVGSGKTIVALMTMLNAIAVKKQAAIMAPTEILARQHLATMQPLCEKLGLKIAALTGRDKGKAKQSIIQSIENGDADIIIGTHALLEDTVTFRNLGCVVIDEQHRFGVEQRLGLSQKHNAIDTLVMTATPIPRSLFLATYGDLDCSRLMEKPPGRKPIDTRTVSLDRMDDVVAGIGRAINEGRQIYWVCPLVEESEQLDLAAATERYEQLSALFPGKVGLVHGRLKAKEKERVMQDFAAAKISLLVATTVIEVGVNVPAASIMVIDHAQRFGLSQLHQLRGRVGRGHEQSRCLLLYSHALSQTARARLGIMRDTEDGFRIAEEDLKLRGAGEILGTKQSGLPDMRFANFLWHQDLFKTAATEVKWILDKDPMLKTPRGENLRLLLQLFGRHEAVNYLLSG
jgi:ATP-dependent DNA helicase RecG